MIGSYLGRTVGLIDEKAATEMLKETKVLYAGLKFAYNDSLAMAKTAFKQEQNILDPLAKWQTLLTTTEYQQVLWVYEKIQRWEDFLII